MRRRRYSALVRGFLVASSRNGASDLSASGVTFAFPSLRSPSTSRLGQFRRWRLVAPGGPPDGQKEGSTQIWLRSQDAVGPRSCGGDTTWVRLEEPENRIAGEHDGTS